MKEKLSVGDAGVVFKLNVLAVCVYIPRALLSSTDTLLTV